MKPGGLFDTGGGSPKKEACRLASIIRHMRRPNTHCELVSLAPLVRVQREAAPPDADAYQAWLDEIHSAERPTQGKKKWDGRKLRRAVVMVRNGCSQREISSVVGVCTSTISTTLRALPEGLAA